MTSLQYFRLFAAEFSTTSDEVVGTWLAIAVTLAEVGCLDSERAAMAQALYAAHLLSLSTRSAQGAATQQGPILSEREGDLARTFGQLKGSNTYMGQTSYGQQYLDIVKVCFGSAIMTRVCP